MKDEVKIQEDCCEWDPNMGIVESLPLYNELPLMEDDVEYENYEALNWSTLSRFLREPAFFDRHPGWGIESKGFTMGTYLHHMLLEPEKHLAEYAKFNPPTNPKTNEPYKSGLKYQEALDAFKAEGKLPIPERGEEILDEVYDNLETYGLLKWLNGHIEVGLVGNVNKTNLKGRLDVYSEDFGIVDLKTTSSQLYSLENDYYRYKIREYGYVEQLAFYATLVFLKTNVLPPCRIVAVQTTIPYQVGLYEINQEILKIASERIIERYIPAFKEYKNGRVPKIFVTREIDSI